jgi:hypothetical protein
VRNAYIPYFFFHSAYTLHGAAVGMSNKFPMMGSGDGPGGLYFLSPQRRRYTEATKIHTSTERIVIDSSPDTEPISFYTPPRSYDEYPFGTCQWVSYQIPSEALILDHSATGHNWPRGDSICLIRSHQMKPGSSGRSENGNSCHFRHPFRYSLLSFDGIELDRSIIPS